MVITISSLCCATWHYMGGTSKIKLPCVWIIWSWY